MLACKQNKTPDVSNIKVDLNVKRFERDFFSIDTNNINASFTGLQQKYPGFLNDFLVNILGLPNEPDSAALWVSGFYRDYKPIFQATQSSFPDLNNSIKDIHYSFQLTKHYFPQYALPKNLITFVGPLEGYSTVLTREGVAVGLQQYMGKDFPLYQSEYVKEIYPSYQVRRFEPAYVPVNVMRNITDDLYPPSNKRLSLIEIMIEQGKHLQLLKTLMPNTSDTLLTGYTESQLKGCYENEGLIWNFFVQNDLLYKSDPFLIRDYINDGPKTTPLGESSPGNIGQFVGWQIVKKYLDKHELTPEQLMNKPAKKIFTESKYKPK
jgi:hypothetical protein